MSGSATLIKFAGSRAEVALAAWQRLRAQCDEAEQKLAALRQHRENYRQRMRESMEQGMSAGSVMAHAGFIGQIEAVVTCQETELGNLEDGCARLWQQLIEARREKRMYEILGERAAARHVEAVSRRKQREIDELLQHSPKAL